MSKQESLSLARESLQRINRRNKIARNTVIAGQAIYVAEAIAHSEGLADPKEFIIRAGFCLALGAAGLAAHRNYRESGLGITAIKLAELFDQASCSISTSTPQTEG